MFKQMLQSRHFYFYVLALCLMSKKFIKPDLTIPYILHWLLVLCRNMNLDILSISIIVSRFHPIAINDPAHIYFIKILKRIVFPHLIDIN